MYVPGRRVVHILAPSLRTGRATSALWGALSVTQARINRRATSALVVSRLIMVVIVIRAFAAIGILVIGQRKVFLLVPLPPVAMVATGSVA